MLWRFCRGVNFWPIHTYKDDVASLPNFVYSSGCHGNQLVICCIYTRNIHMCMIYVPRMYTCKLLLRRVLIFAAGYKHTQVTMCRFSDLPISRLPCHYIVYVIWINMIVCPGLAGNRGDSDWLHGVRDWHVQLSSADSYQEWQVYSSVAYGLPIFIGKQSKLIIYPFQLQHVYSDDKFSSLTISLLPDQRTRESFSIHNLYYTKHSGYRSTRHNVAVRIFFHFKQMHVLLKGILCSPKVLMVIC